MSAFGNFFSKAGDFLGFDGSFGIQGGSVSTVNGVQIEDFGRTPSNSVPIPTRKPTSVSSSAPSGFSLGGVGDFLKGLGDTVSSGFTTYFDTKSKIAQLETAQELEEIKLKTVQQSAQQAPPAAQVILPTFSDFLNDPREAASRVTPAAIAGSGVVQGASNIALYALVAGGLYLALRK